jgi:DNA end-binding protein Ku
MQAIWKGTLGFGLVSVPIRLYSALESSSSGVSFHLLHQKDGGRISFKRVCQTCGNEVAWKDVVKGYTKDDETVEITKEELQALEDAVTRRIEIEGFCESEAVDELFFDTAYYLEPEKGAEKPYALLRDALGETGTSGIAKVAIRSHSRLAAVKARDGAIVLEVLRYKDEVRSTDKLALPGHVKANEREIELARTLIESMRMEFEPERYEDRYKKAVEELVESKLAGKTKLPKAEAERPTKVIDLMKALKASIEQTQKGEKKHAPAKHHANGKAKKRRKAA